MKDRTSRSLLRSVALVGAMAASATVFGNYVKEWNAGTTTGYWDVASNWTTSDTSTNPWSVVEEENIDPAVAIDDYRVGATGAQIAFDKAVTDDIANLYIYAGSVTFSATDASFGLTKDNAFNVGVWFGGDAAATIESGTYSFSEINVGRWTASSTDETTGETTTWPCNGTMTISGGSVTAPAIYLGTDVVTGVLQLDGGTISTPLIAGWPKGSLVIGANGGTFDVGETGATVSAALTGSGTLTVTGNATLNLTGDVSAFRGVIVNNSTGYVIIGAEDAEATDKINIAPGATKDFDPQATYTAWYEDFESNTALQGWLYSGDSRCTSSISTRILADGTSSKYYRLHLAKGGGKTGISATADYALDLADTDLYSFAFDLFPKVAWGMESTLTIRGKKTVDAEGVLTSEMVTLATFVTRDSNQGNGGEKTKVDVTAGSVLQALPIECRGTDVETAAETSKLWYRVVISGNKDADKTYLQVLDYYGVEVIAKTEIGDYAAVSGLSMLIQTNGSGGTVFGLDNIVYMTAEPEGIPANPVIDVTPDSYAGDRTVSITCEDASATIYWRDADGEFAEYTGPITVSSSATILAYAQNASGKSEIVFVPVYANVKLNAPSVARRGWYRMQITAGANPVSDETPTYVYSYWMTGSNTRTVEGASPLVRASDGAAFNIDGARATVTATAEGYQDADQVSYTGYTFDSKKYNSLYNFDWADTSYSAKNGSQWPNDTLIEVDGVNYRDFGVNGKSYANDYVFVSSDEDRNNFPRWEIYRGTQGQRGGLMYNAQTSVGSGRVLFKDMKPGTLIYLNSDRLTDPVNMTLLEGYTNADEYVYEVTGEGETVNATIKMGVDWARIYCIKIYEPIPETTDTFVADEAELVDGAFTVPEGTTTITLGGVDVTKGFYIEGTKAKLLSPWFRWESTEEFGEGMVIDDDAGTVTLDIDLVPGLYYGPASATSLEALARHATFVKYDGTNGDAIKTIKKPDGDTAFFTIYVDVKEPETTTVTTDGENMPVESEEGNGDDQG